MQIIETQKVTITNDNLDKLVIQWQLCINQYCLVALVFASEWGCSEWGCSGWGCSCWGCVGGVAVRWGCSEWGCSEVRLQLLGLQWVG